MPFLAPDAAAALMAVEKDLPGLAYEDMWRDPAASLLARRTNPNGQLPGYSTHNFGLAVDLDMKTILKEGKLRYLEDIIKLMKKRGWYCHRRDGEAGHFDSGHFNFLGVGSAENYLSKCTFDPKTWQIPAELCIWDRHSKDFQLSAVEVQQNLSKIGFYAGPATGERDGYTREAILAFQRAWDLPQSGSADLAFCRVLAFVTAEREVLQLPSWIYPGP